MNRFRKAVAIALVLGLLTVGGSAQIGIGFPGGSLFGAGVPVYDASANANWLIHLGHIVTQIAKTVAILDKVTQQYEHMRFMAQFIENQYKYHAVTTIWHDFSAMNTYRHNSAWLDAVNKGVSVANAWENAVMRTAPYPGGLGRLPASQVEWRQKQVSTLELMDGTGASALDTVGRIRANSAQVEHAMSALENDTLNPDPALNTTAAQMNKANAIALVNSKTLSDTNKLLVTNVELGLMRLKQEHDAMAVALRSEAAFRAQGDAALRSQHDGASELMASFRLP